MQDKALPGIAIIEDHPVVREGLTAYFNKTDRWQVMGTASTLAEAKELLTNIRPDLVLLDIQLDDGWGIDIVPWYSEQARFAEQTWEVPLMAVYSSFEDFAHVSAALGMGVKAYVCKRRTEQELENALLKALEGEEWIDEAARTTYKTYTDLTGRLTKREKEILSLVKRGFSNDQIAASLGINRRTVENLIYCVYDKTNIRSRKKLQEL
ncbi:MAG: response regulator transcription factor [Treponema sp.]|nr:response regulator transcription factor [Treponema sp.]